MHREKTLEVLRDVDATLIPSGAKVKLQKGSIVMVTQALGTSYTIYVNGNLVRIPGKDGDALGLVILEQADINEQPGSIDDKVWVQLKTCFDPDLPLPLLHRESAEFFLLFHQPVQVPFHNRVQLKS